MKRCRKTSCRIIYTSDFSPILIFKLRINNAFRSNNNFKISYNMVFGSLIHNIYGNCNLLSIFTGPLPFLIFP